MKKILGLIALGLVLSGCEPSASVRIDHNAVMSQIAELHGCKAYNIYANGTNLNIVRCPASETVSTATTGKSPVYTTTVMDSIPSQVR